MVGEYADCSNHCLKENDFQDSVSDSNSDEDDSEVSMKFLQWKKNDDGYLTKVEMSCDIDEALKL